MSWRLLIYSGLILDLLIWGYISFPEAGGNLQLYFLDVGQGDSELIKINDIDILIDGGSNAKVLESLSKVLPINDRYLDLVILTHPHHDHFGGLTDVLKNYQIGILIDSGFKHNIKQYQVFEKELDSQKIKRLTLRESDSIKYKDLVLEIISPAINAYPVKIKDLHNNTIVFLLKKEKFKGLFTGDINFKVEDILRQKYGNQLAASLLKVSHHGSNNSTGSRFLKLVDPKIAVIGVGKNNSYGHPKPALLDRLEQANTQIFRTDENGTIKMTLENGQLKIATQK